MTTVSDIEKAIEHLDRDRLAELRTWFEEFIASRWDQQIEEDVHAGHLDAMADEAVEDHRNGRSRPL